jgi:methylated-DNA-protein-cysteine methyltransferase-like protein
MKQDADATRAEIYRVLKAVPRGKVITYGQLAELAGIPRGHRVAARAMLTCPSALPWHRVLGKKDARRARIAIGDPDGAREQRKRLEKEGVAFDASDCVSLRKYGWLPLD